MIEREDRLDDWIGISACLAIALILVWTSLCQAVFIPQQLKIPRSSRPEMPRSGWEYLFQLTSGLSLACGDTQKKCFINARKIFALIVLIGCSIVCLRTPPASYYIREEPVLRVYWRVYISGLFIILDIQHIAVAIICRHKEFEEIAGVPLKNRPALCRAVLIIMAVAFVICFVLMYFCDPDHHLNIPNFIYD